ncbi:MAG: NAD(P)/FAD-dependent oxidoreductase [Caldilineaceae bacterium]
MAPNNDEVRPHVVIVGGGFGGLYAAKSLANQPVRVTLIDRRNFHLFQPLLYQVAMAGLSPGNISAALRSILSRYKNIHVLLGEVTNMDAAQKWVQLADGEQIGYDTLIVATGASHSYFGHAEWETHAPGLKTLEQALDMRRRVLTAYEIAERTPDPAQRRAWLTFAVVGAGPTGVELAGALSEMARYTLAGEFRNIDPTQATVLLIEGADRVLPPYPPDLSAKAQNQLEKLGVSVRTNALVTNITAEQIEIKSGDQHEQIACRTVLWAAGVQASPLGKVIQNAAGAELDRSGRVVVQSDLSVAGFPSLFVIGDLAHFAHNLERPLPGVAPVAMQQGRYVARLILAHQQRSESSHSAQPFEYHDKGSMATIGRAAAVAQIGRLRFGGFFAWLAWLFIHLLYLTEFDNRILVLFQWFWNYITYRRGVRLIVGYAAKSDEEQRKPESSVVSNT